MFSAVRTIKSRLIASFSVLVFFIILLGIFNYGEISFILEKGEEISRHESLMDAVTKIKLSVVQDMQLIMEIVTESDEPKSQSLWKKHEEVASHFSQLVRVVLEGGTIDTVVVPATHDSAIRQVIEQVRSRHDDQFVSGITQFRGGVIERLRLEKTLAGDKQKVHALYNTMVDITQQLEVGIKKRIKQQGDDLKLDNDLLDLSMEIRLALSESLIGIERYTQVQDEASLVPIQQSITDSLAVYDKWMLGSQDRVAHSDDVVLPKLLESLATLHKQSFRPAIAALQATTQQFLKTQANLYRIDSEVDQIGLDLMTQITALEKSVSTQMGNLHSQAEKTKSSVVIYGMIGLLIVVLVATMLAWLIIRTITKKLHNTRHIITTIAHGDLTQRARIADHPDELDMIAREVNLMADLFQQVIRQVILQAHSMSACIRDLTQVKMGLSGDSQDNVRLSEQTVLEHQLVADSVTAIEKSIRQTADEVGGMSAATRQLAEAVISIAAAAEQASSNISTMASAAEQITSNIAGVNSNLTQVEASVENVALSVRHVTDSLAQVRDRCVAASRESQLANQQASSNQAMMAKLADSTKEIDRVIEIINNIAEQTNMLALNASIEAAGAGEVGRGFAVVANEVKDLANQTSNATKTISDVIHGIQEQTKGVVQANKLIADGVARIDIANNDITLAVEEQTAAVNAISQSMNEVSLAAGEVTRAAAELNLAAEDVARSALEAANGTSEVAKSASEASVVSQTLSTQGERLYEMVEVISQSVGHAAEGTRSANEHIRTIGKNTGWINGAIHHISLLINSLVVPGNKLKGSVQDIKLFGEPFEVESIKLAHLGWLGKLENVIRGRAQLKPEEVASGRECAFGKWYYSQGIERFNELPIFHQVGEVHLRVHEVARETVKLVSEGNHQAAEEKMEQFSSIKDNLFDLLDNLYSEGALYLERLQK